MSPQRRSPGDGTIFKRSDGLWVGGIELPSTDEKRKQKRVTSKNRNEVVRKLKELRAMIDAGYIPQSGSVRVGVYLEEWLTSVHKKRVNPSTFPDDKRTVRNHIIPRIGAKRLEHLTPRDVRNMLEQIPTPWNREKAYGLLSRALDTAVKDGLVARNVVAAVDKPQHTSKRHPAFTPKEALHIIRTAETSGDEMWAARWAAGFMTGLRESELIGLEWDRVDLTNDLLDVSWQLKEFRKAHGCGPPVDDVYPCGKKRVSFCPQAFWDLPDTLEKRLCERNLMWTRPKTQRSDRGVPIIAPLHILLERLKDTGPNPHNLVFHHPDGAPLTQSQDQKAWKALLKAAGLDHAPQHTIRRTAATLLRAAQVDEQTRMELFGHASADVQRIYAGSDLELQRAAMGKLADILIPKELD